MLAQTGSGLSQPPKVDNSSHAGFPRGTGELHSEQAVSIRILGPGGRHGVNQIECCLASHEVLGKGLSIRQIGLPNLYPRLPGPFPARQFCRRANKTANHVAGVDQTRGEPSADITGGNGNRDALWGIEIGQ